MPITAAAIETNGWVLRLDVSGSLGTFASYTLDPDGTPRISLASSHAGFVKSAGTAVAGSLSRNLIGTKPLRLPVNLASPSTVVIDETDLGGGSIRVRIALSEHVHATDTGLSLAVLAGWRTGESAASGISVTNNSTIAAPIPIMRWALVPYEVATGSFRLSLVVTSHHPLGFEPVAGVKFTATDGTTVKTVWATALATDNSYGDNLRCYSVTIDPTTATALTAGLLRCDAEVYPWLGAMRTTDAAGTRSMATLRSDGTNADAASPFVVAYDPAGSRYGAMFAFVDPVNGTITAAAGMVQSTLAAAKAVTAASRPRDVTTAVQASYLFNRSLAAANGLAAQTRSVDGMQVVLAAGTHSMGATTVTSGIATPEVPVRIIGDPADSDPRANCIVNLTVTGPNLRVTRVKFDNLSFGLGSNAAISSGQTLAILDRVTAAARSGLEANTTAWWGPASAPTTQVNLYATRVKWWKHGVHMTSGNIRAGLVRATEHSRQVTALAWLKNRFIGNVEDGFTGTGAVYSWTGWGAPTLTVQVEDVILAWNDLRFLRARAFAFTYLAAATAGTPNPSLRRLAIIGNVCERIGAGVEPFYAMGEDISATMSYNIIEANTFVGDRSNSFYSDPLPTTVGETNAQLNQAFVNRVANNAFDWLPTKHDDFNDPQSATLRGTASGYRPQMIEAWSMLYGVGHEGNADTRRATAASPFNFKLEYSGARTIAGTSGAFAPRYANDKSILGPDGASAMGGGNYRPQATTPLAGRVVRSNIDVDADGLARRTLTAAGAFQALAVDIAPAAARSLHRAAATALVPAVQPATARSANRSSGAVVGWSAVLAPTGARHSLAGTAMLGWTGAINPASAALAHRASLAGITPRIGPQSGTIALRDTVARLGWATTLAPSGTRHGHAATAGHLTTFAALVPAGATQRLLAGAVDLRFALALFPAGTAHWHRAGQAGLATTAGSILLVDAGASILQVTSPLLLAGDARAIATIIVGPDPRTVFPNRN